MKKLSLLLVLTVMLLVIMPVKAGATLAIHGTADYLGNTYNLIFEYDGIGPGWL